LNDMTLLMDEFKVLKLQIKDQGALKEKSRNELMRESARLSQIESEKADLLKRIQKLKNDLDYAQEEEAININRELVNELGNLKRILEEERKQRSRVRLLESNVKENFPA